MVIQNKNHSCLCDCPWSGEIVSRVCVWNNSELAFWGVLGVMCLGLVVEKFNPKKCPANHKAMDPLGLDTPFWMGSGCQNGVGPYSLSVLVLLGVLSEQGLSLAKSMSSKLNLV